MWIARDKDGRLSIFSQKPKRNGEIWVSIEYFIIDKSLFPELTWEDEPIEVELTIKK